MRAFLTCAVLTVAALTINAAPASARPDQDAALVDSWYHRYLGRHVDPIGLSDQTRALRHGTPADVVEAAILSSPEYYARSGNTPEGFVAALFRDVLGRRAFADEFGRYVHRVQVHGRNAVALQILNERAIATATPIVVMPAPVIVRSAPVIVPSVVVPAYRHHGHIVVDPRPAVSIRLNFGW